MPKIYPVPRISISSQREEIPISSLSGRRVPDPAWRYVDKKGHGHFWRDARLPTLYEKVIGKHWVGDEYDGSEIDITEFRCRECEEVIEPQYKVDYSQQYAPSWYTFTVVIDGEEFILTEEMYARSVEAWVEALRKICSA